MAHHNSGAADEVIEQAKAAAEGKRVSVGEVLDAIGHRSYGPIYVLVGLISISPLGALPGSPTVTCALVMVMAFQQLLGRRAPWLPRRVEAISVRSDRYERAFDRVQRLAQQLDKLTRERWSQLVSPPMQRLIAIVLMLLGLSFLPFELLPFGADIPALALLLVGLGLTSKDGLFVVLGVMWAPVAAIVITLVLR
jgi:hypothetical protein